MNEKQFNGVTENKNKKNRIVKRSRNKSFNLRFTEEEFTEVNEKIEKSKLNRTDFILKCIRKKNIIVIDDLTAALVEIRKQGVNINQMARAINQYKLDLKIFGLTTYGIEDELKTFSSELEKIQNENIKILEMLNKILEKENV